MNPSPSRNTPSKAEKHALVEETISQLKLKNCADTNIGNEIHRGISGGKHHGFNENP